MQQMNKICYKWCNSQIQNEWN